MSENTRIDSPWHHLTPQQAMEQLQSGSDGLSEAEAKLRLAQHGANRLPEAQRQTSLHRFLLQFHNLLIYVLLAAAVITALLGHWVDFGVILAVVVVNALIGFIQEGKAEKALDAIRRMLTHEALVLRDGRRETIPAEELVPGDVVFLQSGDKVPADLRLIETKNLHIEEAMLTGESLPAEKSTAAAEPLATLGDRFGMAFSGTLVTSGTARGLVVATGAATELGRINQMLADVQTLTTPLLQQMASFARLLTVVVIALAAGTFAFGYYLRDYSAADMFLAAVGLIVAAIPEGLPAIITITLAIGVQRMAGRNAIIRRLPAVETLGAVTVICSDKTGTLTRNEMTVTAVVTADHLFEVAGIGYDPHGSFLLDQQEIQLAKHPTLAEMGRAAILCNDAELLQGDEGWRIEGDPTEGALLTLGRKLGLERDFEVKQWPRIDVIPFESEHRFMGTLHHNHSGHGFVYLKGAPERVLTMCHRQRCKGEDQPFRLNYWKERTEELASRGMRVLAVAYKVAPDDFRQLHFADVQTGMTLLGLYGIIDPPRQEAIEAVRDCRAAGIRVKMITGDHALTASAIGAQMGIGETSQAVTGEELEVLDEEELAALVPRVDIFARATPEHKLRLVTALQAHNEVVAMTGDGVNDAPALKRANIGIAMGIKGTEVSKEAAEMVLADDNFASIAHAVEEGRTVYDNIRKAILFILPTNGAEALIILAAIALGRTLPITPVQILWINMITAVTLALALAFEPKEAGVMRRPPRDPKGPMLGAFLLWRLSYVSLILVAGTFGMFIWARAEGASIELARTIAVNTLVLFEAWYLLNSRYLHDSVVSKEGLFGNRYVVMAIGLVITFQLLFTYLPPMQTLFGTAPLDGATWLRIVAVSSSVFVLVELEKFIFNLLERRKEGR
jgi:magnesium-transporting ATPase (P-type)